MSPVIPLGTHGIRAWRWVAAIALLATTVATHWPRLTFGPEGPSDKWVHAIAFGVLTWFAWEARWIRRMIPFGLAVCAYAAIDESTQQLALFQRHTSIEDYGADVCGIAVACTLLWPPRAPVSAPARLRVALGTAARARMWDRPTTWLGLATTALVSAFVGALVSLGYWYWVAPGFALGQVMLLGTCSAVYLGVAVALTSATRASTRILRRDRCCFQCGTPVQTALAAEARSGACNACAAPWRAIQWSIPAATDELGRSMPRRPALFSTTLVLGFVPIALLTVALALSALRGPTGFNLLHGPMRSASWHVATLSVWIVGCVAWSRMLRTRQRARREREGSVCIACGHNVAGSPVHAEAGRCPECGGQFIRLDETA